MNVPRLATSNCDMAAPTLIEPEMDGAFMEQVGMIGFNLAKYKLQLHGFAIDGSSVCRNMLTRYKVPDSCAAAVLPIGRGVLCQCPLARR